MKKVIILIIVSCTTLFCKERSEKVLSMSNSEFDLRNGVLFYGDAKFNGTLVDDIKVNRIKIITPYINGKKHGKEIKTYYNDSLAEIRFYTKGFKTGIHEGWWPNGTKKFEFYFNEKGEYNGLVKEWYSNGQPYKEFNYIKGKEKGSQKMWQPDGKVRANYVVTNNGERFGLIGLKKCYTLTVSSNELKRTK